MATVNQILSKKGNRVWSVEPDARVFDALKLLAKKDVGALLVMDHDVVVGIVSERDYARKVILMGKSSMNIPVSEIMTTDLISVNPTHSIGACMSLMTEYKIRHLPVIEDGELRGIISIGDVVKWIISDQEFIISQLENYIKTAK